MSSEALNEIKEAPASAKPKDAVAKPKPKGIGFRPCSVVQKAPVGAVTLVQYAPKNVLEPVAQSFLEREFLKQKQ